jgi:hypothetical protein
MKKIIGLIVVFAALQASAQDREPVYSIVKGHEEISWYETQSKLWKESVDEDETDGEAWYNYYMANRGLKNLSKSEELRAEYLEKCTKIADACYKAIPNSFVGNHLMYYDKGISSADTKYLLKADEINPDDYRNWDALIVYYQTILDIENAEIVAKKMHKANQLSSNLLNWGYNVLAELDENAIVFTAGDNDTEALWLVQGALGFRKDVTVINASLVQIKEHRKKLTDKLGLEEFVETDNLKGMMNHFLINSKEIPAYIALSAIGYLNTIGVEDDLYLNGLTYKYSASNFDNSIVIRRNYEKRYLIDYLKFDFSDGAYYQHIKKHLNGMYLASMIKLYKMYKVGEEIDKAANIRVLIDQIAASAGRKEFVEEFLKNI